MTPRHRIHNDILHQAENTNRPHPSFLQTFKACLLCASLEADLCSPFITFGTTQQTCFCFQHSTFHMGEVRFSHLSLFCCTGGNVFGLQSFLLRLFSGSLVKLASHSHQLTFDIHSLTHSLLLAHSKTVDRGMDELRLRVAEEFLSSDVI